MTTYRVTWEIDVEADTPREAAIAAMLLQDERTKANEFEVGELIGQYRVLHVHSINLGDEPRHLLLEALAEAGEIELEGEG